MSPAFLVLLILPLSLAANCPKCPLNGIWSEWTVNGLCATTCGACSNVTETRTCSSTIIGCPCIGATSQMLPCNTQACNMPRTNAKDVNCCQGTPMIINNWYHCSSVKADYTLDCCPDGGYWSDWSDFSKIVGKVGWTRTRTCVSGSHKCPCTGDSTEIVYKCPCQPIQLMSSSDNPCSYVGELKGYEPFVGRSIVQKSSQCEMELVLEATNFRGEFISDAFTADPQHSTYKLASVIGISDSTGACTVGYYHLNGVNVDIPKDTGVSVKRVYTCDLKTLRYGGNGMTNIEKLAQFYRNPTGRG